MWGLGVSVVLCVGALIWHAVRRNVAPLVSPVQATPAVMIAKYFACFGTEQRGSAHVPPLAASLIKLGRGLIQQAHNPTQQLYHAIAISSTIV